MLTPRRIVARTPVATCSALVALCLCGSVHGQQAAQPAVDNGTDPTKFSLALFANYEYIDIKNGIRSGTLRLNCVTPLGENKDYALRLRVPVAKNDVFGRDGAVYRSAIT
jgi:hypothetical protein